MTDPRPASTSPRDRTLRKRSIASRRTVHLIQAAIVAALLLPALVVAYLTSASAYLSTGATADRSWFWQNQLPQGNPLRAMSWVGTSTGWAVGVNGTVLKTADGGSSWTVQDPATHNDLTGVSFATANIGWTVGISGTIKKTVDGGTTWTSQTSGTSANFRWVSFASSNIGVAVGDAGSSTVTIRYTSDGGATWRAAATTSTVGLTGVQMVSTTVGWAVGGTGQILKTVDGGATWTVRPSPTTAGLASISFAPGGVIGYFVGNAALPNWTIYKTTDSGATWTAVSGLGSTGAVNLFGVDAFDANNAVAVGANGAIRRTTDGGTTWTNQSQNNIGSIALRAVKLLDAARAYAIADSGLMFYARNGSDSWFALMQGSLATWYAVDFADVNNGWAVGTNGAISRTGDAGGTWEQQASGINAWRAVRFVTSTSGWVAGDAGAIRHTANGIDWVVQNSTSTQQLNGLWFTSATTGFAVGANGTILKTSDAGVTWVAKPSGTTQALNAVWFADANNGFAVGGNGNIRKTVNAGETWATSTSGTTQTLLSVRGTSATQVWVSGNNGVVRTTANGGTSWTALTAGAGTNPIRTIFFTTSSFGWLGSSFGIVQKSTDGGVTWVSQNTGMPTSTLDPATGVHGSWFSGNTGYLVGDSGLVRRTLDGGTTWISLQHGTLSTLNSVMFPDATNGWASGTGGTMMRTSDGGQTWSQQKTGSTVSLNQVVMNDSANGYAVGDNGVIRRTTNGGIVWVAQTSGVTVNLSAIGVGDATHAIVGGTGALKYTSNAGSTWTTASVLPTQPVTGLYMVDANRAWAVTTRVSGNNAVWNTSNGGANWTAQATNANANLWDVYFRDGSTGYACGDSGIILKTTDGGATWVRKTTPTTNPLYWIRFADANTGWAIGGGGVAVRTTDGGETWTVRDSGTNQGLSAIAFSGTARSWIVGVNGTILQSNNLVAPTTTVTVAPASPNGANSWYAGVAPTITTTATAGSTTYYGWTSAAGPFSTYSAPFSTIEGTQTLYYYSVDVASNAETVKTLALKTDISNPTVPSSVAVTLSSITTSSADITWADSTDAVSGVARYEVYVDGTYYGQSTTPAMLLAGLSPFTSYSITVRSVDRAGNVSAFSSPATALLTKTLDTAPYTTLLTATPFAPNGLNDWYVGAAPAVTLQSLPIYAPAPVIHYSWASDTGPWTDYASALTPPSGPSILYYWTEGNAGRADELVKSQAFKVDTQTPAAPPVIAAATSYQSINASWTPVADTPSGIARYDVFVDGTLYASVTSPLVDIVALHKATAYDITVQTVNSAGTTSSLSATVTATTDNSPLPAAPRAVYAKAPTGDSVYIDWSATTDFVGTVSYRVWRSSDGVTYSAIATTTGGVLDCSYIDNGLRSSTRYWYAISTVDSRGESALSDNTSGRWPYVAPVTYWPPRPLGVTATPMLGAVFIQWTPSPNPAILGYIVKRAPRSLAAPSAVTTLTPVPTTNLGYIDWAVNDGEPYYYTVTAIDASGTLSMPSVEIEAKSIIEVPGTNAMPHSFGDASSGCVCHGPHSSAGVDTLIRFPGLGKQTMCPTCHAPGTAYQEFLDPLLESKHAEGATPTVDQPFSCITCHVPLFRFDGQPNNLMRVNGSSPCVVVTDTPAGNGFCYKCHGPGSTLPMGDLTSFESAGHRNIPPPPTGAGITCDVCHESHSARNPGLLKYRGYMVCMPCHTASASNPNETDIYTNLSLDEASNSRHPLLPQDQLTGASMACENCHNTHTTSKTAPLVDPHNPSPAGSLTGTRADEKSFCFRCHNGQQLPTNAETQPWANAVLGRNATTSTLDVQTLYQTNVHGFGQRSDSATTTAFLRPDMGYKYGDVLECRACHDPHGTANGDAIQSEIVSASGDKTIHAVLTARLADGVKDFRFFCNTCHIWDSVSHDARASIVKGTPVDTTVFPTNCGACHSHVLGGVVDGGF